VQSAVEGIHLGIDDYIIKPSNADALVALLAEKLTARFRASSPLRPLPPDYVSRGKRRRGSLEVQTPNSMLYVQSV